MWILTLFCIVLWGLTFFYHPFKQQKFKHDEQKQSEAEIIIQAMIGQNKMNSFSMGQLPYPHVDDGITSFGQSSMGCRFTGHTLGTPTQLFQTSHQTKERNQRCFGKVPFQSLGLTNQNWFYAVSGNLLADSEECIEASIFPNIDNQWFLNATLLPHDGFSTPTCNAAGIPKPVIREKWLSITDRKNGTSTSAINNIAFVLVNPGKNNLLSSYNQRRFGTVNNTLFPTSDYNNATYNINYNESGIADDDDIVVSISVEKWIQLTRQHE